MKKINYILLIIYALIIIYIGVFNWKIFTVQLNVNLGFSLIKIPFVLMIFLFGFIVFIIQELFFTNKIEKLQHKLELSGKNIELFELKISFYEKQENRIEEISKKTDKLQIHFQNLMDAIKFKSKKVDEKQIKNIEEEVKKNMDELI